MLHQGCINGGIGTDNEAAHQELADTEAPDGVWDGLENRKGACGKKGQGHGVVIAMRLSEFSPQGGGKSACQTAAGHDEAGGELDISFMMHQLSHIEGCNGLYHQKGGLQEKGEKKEFSQGGIMGCIGKVLGNRSLFSGFMDSPGISIFHENDNCRCHDP